MKTPIKHSSVALVVLLLFSAVSCKKQDAADGQKIQPVNINVEVLKTSTLIDGIQVAGTVKAFEEATMSPEEGGVVKEWVKKKGEYVNKGDLIVALKDEVIKAGYEAAEAQYKMAELNLEKQQSVYEQQGISELQYKNLIYGRDAAKANYELMKARWERTQLRSPFNGIVDNTIPNAGEFAPPGVPIARVVNTSTIKIQAEIPELYSGSVHVGTTAEITFDAVPDVKLHGKVSYVASTVSAANRTMLVEIILSNPNRKLKPEMVAKVAIMREKKEDAIMVSHGVIQLVDRDRYVVYVENNGKAEERRVKIGGRQGNLVEISEGLKAGDRLITVGYQKLINGTPVVVTQ